MIVRLAWTLITATVVWATSINKNPAYAASSQAESRPVITVVK